jgi:hypothetical protein
MDQAIMKFASTTARDAAFGGAGEPTLSEGMFAYTSDTNTLWFYTGSAWEVATIKPSLVDAKGDLLAGTAADTVDRLAVGTNGQVLTANSSASTGLAWATVSAGLVCVKAQTAVSGVQALNVDGVFTSDYTNYVINLNLAAAAGTGFNIGLRAGGVTTATDYGFQSFAANGGTIGGARSTAQTSFELPNLRTAPSGISIQLFSPQLAQYTTSTWNGMDIISTTAFVSFVYWGLQHSSTQFDGFRLTTSSNMDGSYSVYGYSKTV